MVDIIGDLLNEAFVIAKKRYQPYINLVNEIYNLENIFSIDSFKKYKELESIN